MEVIIYKEAVQVPENSKSLKVQYYGQEITCKLQSAILAQRITNSARCSNLAGLLKLDIDQVSKLAAEITRITAEMPKLKSAYIKNLAIRNRFFSFFLRDYYPAQYILG